MKPISAIHVTYSRVSDEYTVDAYGYTARGAASAKRVSTRRFKTEEEAKAFAKSLSVYFIMSGDKIPAKLN